jgi:hypothetical protein
MSDHMKHTEKVYIDEVTRKGRGTFQWFVEPRSELNNASHPISQNNQLDVFICGEKGFASIAADIKNAKSSIDLCCWGFDPGMELVRAEGLWPRGPTFGDLLIEAGERGVCVRLLVWLHPGLNAASIAIGMLNPRNLPGWTHDSDFFNRLVFQQQVKEINAQRMLAAKRDAYLKKAKEKKPGAIDIGLPDQIAIAEKARVEYCCRWFRAARRIDGSFKNVFVHGEYQSQPGIGRRTGQNRTRWHDRGRVSSPEVDTDRLRARGRCQGGRLRYGIELGD